MTGSGLGSSRILRTGTSTFAVQTTICARLSNMPTDFADAFVLVTRRSPTGLCYLMLIVIAHHMVASRVARATYGVICAVPAEAHTRRRGEWEIDPTGDCYVPNFEAKLHRVSLFPLRDSSPRY